MVDKLPIHELCAHCFDHLIIALKSKEKKPQFPLSFKGVLLTLISRKVIHYL